MPADIPPSCCDPPQRVAVLQRYAILDTSPERDYDDLCRLAAQICRTPMAFIGFMDARRQWFKSELGFGVREIPLFASLCRHFCEDAETLLVPDTLLDERFCHDPLCVETPGVRFYAGAAIRSAGGVILGTLCVLDRKPGTLDSFQRESLAVLARQIMSMLERRRTEILLNEQRCFTFLRADLSAHMGSAAPLPLILRYCTEQLVDSLGLSSAQIWTLAPGENLLCLESSAGLYPAPDGSPDRMKVGESQIGRVALVRRPQVRNRRMNAAEKGEFEGDAGEGNLAFVGYPLVVADRMVGVLALFAQGAYSELILENLAPVAENIAHCIDRKQTEETLRRKEEVSRFLAKASAELAELVDFQSTLQKIAGVAVPDFADWCTVDLVDSQGNFRRLAAAHVDPAKVQLAHELMYRFPPRPEDGHGISKVCRTGQSEWVRDISDAMLEGLAHNPAHLQALRELGVKSSIVAPLVRRDMVFGALTFGLIESKRHFNTADLLAAEDLASRAAVTTESASLYQKLQQAHQHKDEFLATLA
ncbi:MAG: GAF domain-containing protein, partial [Verrucomicrobiota bacterium]